ncbi:Mur ligase family protein [Rubrivirga sp.]|uniref:Mur ligase family protein n=1 Tax=Rubrivirga sp. TaxID=1885344 RepID=UPI003B515B25
MSTPRTRKDLYVEYLSFWAGLVVRLRRPLVVGVTGSVGKTTTKETLAAVLAAPEAEAAVGLSWATPGNMNDNLGVALTLLGYRGWRPRWGSEVLRAVTVPIRALRMATVGPYPRVVVLELGAGVGGDVRRTAPLARPTIGIVTAVGPAHLEVFGTVEGVAEVKGALVRVVPPSGLVVLGADNALASGMDALARAPVVKVPGKGQALSDAVARVVAERLGVPADAVDRALAGRQGFRGRQEVLEVGAVTVINDAFNANPLSMAYGLETLAERARPGRRPVAVLGEMAEMGETGPRYHREMADVARSSADLVVGVGPLARLYEPDHWFETSEDCAEAIPGLVRDGDYVLVKGSHSSHLRCVVDALRRTFGPVPADG